MSAATKGFVVLTLEFRRAGNRWTGYCQELGTATFGRSLPEAEKRLKEAVWLHLNTLEDVGESKRFFEEHNITCYSTKPQKPATISIPFNEKAFIQPHIQPLPERELVPAG